MELNVDKSMKKILDACCGSRMMWFDKKHPDALFCDIRSDDYTLCDGRILQVRPDQIINFTSMPFEDNSFYMVVFDPPHIDNLGRNAWMAQKYGCLLPNWEMDIKEGFSECMRVLKPNGILIFKWNEFRVKLNKVLDVIEYRPLFGHTSGRRTIWMAFMKQPKP